MFCLFVNNSVKKSTTVTEAKDFESVMSLEFCTHKVHFSFLLISGEERIKNNFEAVQT